jgi:DNA-binding NtrC family response regulator
MEHQWPGNVRETQEFIERWAYFNKLECETVNDIPALPKDGHNVEPFGDVDSISLQVHSGKLNWILKNNTLPKNL